MFICEQPLFGNEPSFSSGELSLFAGEPSLFAAKPTSFGDEQTLFAGKSTLFATERRWFAALPSTLVYFPSGFRTEKNLLPCDRFFVLIWRTLHVSPTSLVEIEMAFGASAPGVFVNVLIPGGGEPRLVLQDPELVYWRSGKLALVVDGGA